VVFISAPVEDDLAYTFLLGILSQQGTDHFSYLCFILAAQLIFDLSSEATGCGQGCTAAIIDDLCIDIAQAAKYAQPRLVLAAGNGFPYAGVPSLSGYIRTYFSHGLLPFGGSLASLARLQAQPFTGIFYALTLVRIRNANAPDFSSSFTYQFLIYACYADFIDTIDNYLYAFRLFKIYRVAVSHLQGKLIASFLRTVSDASQLQVLLKSLGNALDHVI
jgi:hypothetical protein